MCCQSERDCISCINYTGLTFMFIFTSTTTITLMNRSKDLGECGFQMSVWLIVEIALILIMAVSSHSQPKESPKI